MTERCFPNARRIHRAVQRAPSYADTRLLGKYSVFDHKKFSVYNLPFKLKYKVQTFLCNGTPKMYPPLKGCTTSAHLHSSSTQINSISLKEWAKSRKIAITDIFLNFS